MVQYEMIILKPNKITVESVVKQYVIITGSTSGIGRELVRQFLKDGSFVIAIGRNEKELGLMQAEPHSDHLITVCMDFTKQLRFPNPNSIFKPGDTILCFIYCATTPEPATSLLNVSEQQIDESIAVNVKAPILLIQQLAPYFDKIGNTRILFMGSDYVAGLPNSKKRPGVTGVYAIAKSAVYAAFGYFQLEMKQAQIGYLNPGATKTKTYHSVIGAMMLQGKLFVVPKPALPEDVASFIKKVIQTTSCELFYSTEWDYRKEEHHNLLKPAALQAKL